MKRSGGGLNCLTLWKFGSARVAQPSAIRRRVARARVAQRTCSSHKADVEIHTEMTRIAPYFSRNALPRCARVHSFSQLLSWQFVVIIGLIRRLTSAASPEKSGNISAVLGNISGEHEHFRKVKAYPPTWALPKVSHSVSG